MRLGWLNSSSSGYSIAQESQSEGVNLSSSIPLARLNCNYEALSVNIKLNERVGLTRVQGGLFSGARTREGGIGVAVTTKVHTYLSCMYPR